jgi:hypothetical protein
MSLFPNEDILAKEIESWKGFADRLPAEEDRTTFMKMLNHCYKYAKAINAKAHPFPSEPVIMALLFSQHKMIEWLEGQISKPKISVFSCYLGQNCFGSFSSGKMLITICSADLNANADIVNDGLTPKGLGIMEPSTT